jgi:presenilin-like A22 family membrane protease
MKKPAILGPVLWSSLTFILGAAIASFVAFRETVFLENNPQIATEIGSIEVSPQFPVIYFFSAVVVIGLVLFLIPVSKLKWLFGILFILLYAWGIFVVLWLTLPSLILVTILAVAGGLAWFFISKVWLHNILMLIALAGIAAVFGILIDPWPVMIFLLVVAIYDFLAVRFGYMMWMAKRLSQSNALPAFVVPKTRSNWNQNMKATGIQNLVEGEAAEREYSILGGGDIGFPLILMVSVFAAYGFTSSLIVAAFSLVGLIGAYVIQLVFLKGKPVPAIPPISLTSLVGLLIVHFIVN